MDWIDAAVESFGQSMGLPSLRLDADGMLALTLDDGSEIALQDLKPHGGQDFVVTLTKTCAIDPARALRSALAAADYRHSPQWAVQVALEERDLVVTLRVPRSAMLQSSLEEAVDRVLTFHQEANHGA